MRSSPSTVRHSFESARRLSFVLTFTTFAWRRFICLPEAVVRKRSRMPATSRRVYQTSMFRISAKRAIASRYSRTAVVVTERRSASPKPPSRPATAKLAASRLTSHSNGPGRVSSKSLMLKTRRPVGRREDAEVREVRVAAELRVQARPWSVREVRRHQVGGTAEEGERRGEHPPVTDRAELGKSCLGLLLEKVDGVSPHRPRLPLPVNRARHVAARALATGGALGRRELLHAPSTGVSSCPSSPRSWRTCVETSSEAAAAGSDSQEVLVDFRHCLAPFRSRSVRTPSESE